MQMSYFNKNLTTGIICIYMYLIWVIQDAYTCFNLSSWIYDFNKTFPISSYFRELCFLYDKRLIILISQIVILVNANVS